MIKTIYFERGTQLDKHLGSKYRFESIKIGATADTFKEAQKEVEKNIAEYIAELKGKEEQAELARKAEENKFGINEPKESGTAKGIREFKTAKLK
ncbi:hypothetical protein M0R04_12070 [Candidatus Dojkabacteria bacterium]|jgi:hypothetical protein|nr:hypothetical protein [Candidatus Dojkabacteria bacterium]